LAKTKKFNEKHQRNFRDDHSRMSNHGNDSHQLNNLNHSDAKYKNDESVISNKSRIKKNQSKYGIYERSTGENLFTHSNNGALSQKNSDLEFVKSNDPDDTDGANDQSTVVEESYSRLDRPNSRKIDDRHGFKSKDKKPVHNKFYHLKQNKSRKESISSRRLEKNEGKRKQKNIFKVHDPKKKEDAKSSSFGTGDNKVVKGTKTNNSSVIPKGSLAGDLNDSKQASTKVDRKGSTNRHKQKKKIVTDFEETQKAEKLRQKPSKISKLHHTGKDLQYKVAYTSHKIGQLESRKESDENAAVMATDDGVDFIRNYVKPGSKKKTSKLKFEKIPNAEQSSFKNKKGIMNKSTSKRGANTSKAIQKKNIKRQYSKAVNTQISDVKARFKYTLKKIKEWEIGALKKMGIYMIGPVCIFAVAAVMILSVVQSFSSGVSTVISTSYQSSDADVTNSHLIYTGLEADLRYAIKNVEDDYPDYDEYRYDIDNIGHDMHMILAYLTARFGDFSPNDVRTELNSIFNEQYDYTLTRVVEVRYKTVWHSSTDPETGQTHSWSTQEPYDWIVLEVDLDTKNLESIILLRMDDDEKDLYEVLIDTKGNFMSMPSPFKESWRHNISSHFGYRLDPVSDEVTFHQGIDIAKPIGTELISIIEGQVSKVGYDGNGYGHYVVVKTKTDESILYGHCSSILVNEEDEVVVGDTIALVGSSGKSTGPHVHLEIRDSSGNKLNPYFYLTEE